MVVRDFVTNAKNKSNSLFIQCFEAPLYLFTFNAIKYCIMFQRGTRDSVVTPSSES